MRPFTVEHFAGWARRLILDNGEDWQLEPFQSAFVADLFTGVPEAWLVVPEGNGKTTLAAGLALYHSAFREDALVSVAASSREQAEILYRQAEGFVLRSDALRDDFLCQEGYRRIRHLPGNADRQRVRKATAGSRIQIRAADDRTGDGGIDTLDILEELHRHRDLRLYRTWRGKLGKRGGQLVAISTAGEPGSEFELAREQLRQTAAELTREGSFVRAVSEGAILHDWAVPEGADVEDLDVVKAANPFSGVTVEALRLKRASPAMTLPHWRRFVCNLPTRSQAAAITEAEWHAAATGEQIPAGEPVWAGLDVSWKWDTTALVPLWVRDPEFRLLGPATILEPPRTGESLDPHLVEAALVELHERNPLETLVMDTSRAEQLAAWVEEELGVRVIDRTQSNAYAAADYARFMEALRHGWLKHSGDPGLTRHALNAIARVLPYGDARFDRPAQSRRDVTAQPQRVIDGLVAAAMVHWAATERAEEDELPAMVLDLSA